MKVKGLAKSLLMTLGYEIRKLPTGGAYAAQQMLFKSDGAKIIFDVGACVGLTAIEYHRRFPDATIYAFEPLEESFRQLVTATKRSRNVRPIQLAVAEQPDTLVFYPSKAANFSSLLRMDSRMSEYYEVSPSEPTEVRATSLDSFCSDQHISRIDILKMDIQGAELRALKGAKHLLANEAVRAIYLEINFAPLYADQVSFWELAAWLDKAGFSLYGLYQFGYGRNSFVTHADALFVNQDLSRSLSR